MPRPPKPRNVCRMPYDKEFGPRGRSASSKIAVLLSIDELETVRLIDLEGYTQEEAANQMDVARTTVQRIYDDARRKIADAIVNGKHLEIGGGNFRLCDEEYAAQMRPRRLEKPEIPHKGESMKRIAMALDANEMADHFGHCEVFALYDVEDGVVKSKTMLPNPPHQPGFLPAYLAEQSVDTVLAGNLGKMARNLLDSFGIEVVCGASGQADDVIKAYLAGSLTDSNEACGGHEHYHEHHDDHEHHGGHHHE